MAEADRLGLAALALTDHHGFYGVVRFAEAARACGLPTVFGTEVTLAPAEPAHRRARPHRGAPRRARPRPRRLRAPLDGAGRRAPRGRGEGAAGLHPRRAGPRRGRPLAGAERLPQGGGPRRADGCRAPGGLPGGGAPRRRVRARQRGARAVGPRGPARHGPQRRAGASRRRVGRRRRGHQQRALRHAGTGSGSPPRSPPCGRAVPWPSSRAGCRRPRRPACAARPSSPGASPAGPASSSAPPSWGGPARSTCASWRRGCPTSPSPRAWTSRATCVSW